MTRLSVAIFLSLVHAISYSASRTSKPWIPGEHCVLRNITISVLHDPPYINTEISTASDEGILMEYLREVLFNCFKSYHCPSKYIKALQVSVLESKADLLSAIEAQSTDIALPIPPSLTSQDLRSTVKEGVRYFSVLKSPGPALVVSYRVCKSLTHRMMLKSMLSVWPLLVVTVLLAGIAGVCIWALEYHNGERQFSRPFTHGSYEGFWWAVVSMTSVGYGDQVPKSRIGRLFAMVWIFLGVSVISVLTATLTSAITVVSVNQQCKDMQGKNIGVLNNSESENTARHRGANVTGFPDVGSMFSSLTTGFYEGILLDRMRAYYYLNKLHNDDFRVSLAIDSPLSYSLALVPTDLGQVLANDSCFMGLLGNPHGRVNKIAKNYIKPVKPLSSSSDDQVGIFPAESVIIRNVLAGIGTVLAVLIVCGAAWEICYHRKARCSCLRSSDIPNQELVNVNTSGVQLHRLGNDQIATVKAAIDTLTAEIEKLKEVIRENEADNETAQVQDDSMKFTGPAIFARFR